MNAFAFALIYEIVFLFLGPISNKTQYEKVQTLIQEGIERMEFEQFSPTKKDTTSNISATDEFRSSLESQQARRLRGAPRRIKLYKPL